MTVSWAGAQAVLATRHRKGDVIEPALRGIGLVVETVAVDTDLLGTFTRDVPRPAPPHQTAVRKARMGMEAAGAALGLASEGSFGPHPEVPLVTVDHEIVVAVDDRRGIVVTGRASSTSVVAFSRFVEPGADLAALLAPADLPRHAVVVLPGTGRPHPVFKGLVHLEEVQAAVAECAASSPDGRALVETDLRAHVCPSRREVIRAAADDLAVRLASPCPHCGSPGWGPVDVVTGLPCSLCGGPVERARAVVEGCPVCPRRRERPVAATGATADPAECPRCNP